MATLASMPGNWPREYDSPTDYDIFTQEARQLERANKSRAHPAISRPIHEDHAPTRLALATDSNLNSRQSFINSPVSSNESFVLHSETPNRRASNNGLPYPVSPVLQSETSIPRLILRVDTLSATTRNAIEASQASLENLSREFPNLENSPVTQNQRLPLASSTSPPEHKELHYAILSLHDSSYFSTASEDPGEGNSASISFGSGYSNEAEPHDFDWRSYDPPDELTYSNEELSLELERLLVPSIERAKSRLDGNDQRRQTAVLGEPEIDDNNQLGSVDVIADANPPPSLGSQHETNTGLVNLSSNGYSYLEPEVSVSSARRHHRVTLGSLASLFKRKKAPSSNEQQRLGSSAEGLSLQDSMSPSGEESVVASDTDSEIDTAECVSCLDDFPQSELLKLSCHSYCTDCFRALVNTALESETHWPVKCCLNPIPRNSILPHLEAPAKSKFQAREAEWAIPVAERIYCSERSCSAWIAPRYMKATTHSAQCNSCSHKTCTMCRGPSHASGDCPQDGALQATIDLAEVEGWKRCYSCHALVEHNRGCRHMTCRCKAQFCYICSLPWRTCGCTDAQLVTVQAEANARREARRHDETQRAALAAAQAEEEAIILREVAEFIRQEEEREAAAAEAQRRRDEEERQREEEARMLREFERVSAISLRFHELRDELESLHDIQRIQLLARYENEEAAQKSEENQSREVLRLRHVSEMTAQRAEMRERVTKMEKRFQNEFQERHEKEKRVSETYEQELEAFWLDREDGKSKVEAAMRELKMEHDRTFAVWDHYRKGKIQAIMEENRSSEQALVDVQQIEMSALEGVKIQERLERKKKRLAEARWTGEVMRERDVMLQELENAAYSDES